MSFAQHFEQAVRELAGFTPNEWDGLTDDQRETLVFRHGQRVWRIAEAVYGRREERNWFGHLPGVYLRPDYTVGAYVTRRERRWTVALRLPEGGMIYLAEYRWHWQAALWVRRSWKLASR